MKKGTASIFLLTASLIWGVSFTVMKSTLEVIPTNYLLAFRFTVGTIGLLYTVFKFKGEFTPKAILHGVLVGLCLYCAFFVQTTGLLFIGAGKNALITAVYVVLVPFLMWIFTKKAPKLPSVIAGLVCFLGIVILSVDDAGMASNVSTVITEKFGSVLSAKQMEFIGIGLTLISGILYGLHIVLVNQFGKTTNVMPLTFMQYAVAAVCAWTVAIFTEDFPVISQFDGGTWMSLVYVGIFATLIAFTFQNIGVKHAPADYASILLCLESLFGCIVSVIFTDEALTWNIALGAIIIVSSVIISELSDKLSKKKSNQVELTPVEED